MCYNFGMSCAMMIERDVYCLDCGYNLRAIGMDGDCPECGLGVSESTQYLRSKFSPKYNKSLYWGIALLAGTFLSQFFVRITWVIHALLSPLPAWASRVILDLYFLLGIACLTASVFLLTRQEILNQTLPGKRPLSFLRKLSIFLWLPYLGSNVISLLNQPPFITAAQAQTGGSPLTNQLSTIFHILTSACMVIILYGLVIHVRNLTMHLHDRRLTKNLTRCITLFVVCMIAFMALSFIANLLLNIQLLPKNINQILGGIMQFLTISFKLWLLTLLWLFIYQWRTVKQFMAIDYHTPKQAQLNLLANRYYLSINLFKVAAFLSVLCSYFYTSNSPVSSPAGVSLTSLTFIAAVGLGLAGLIYMAVGIHDQPGEFPRSRVSVWFIFATLILAVLAGAAANAVPGIEIVIACLILAAVAGTVINLQHIAKLLTLKSLVKHMKWFLLLICIPATLVIQIPIYWPKSTNFKQATPVFIMFGLFWFLIILVSMSYEMRQRQTTD